LRKALNLHLKFDKLQTVDRELRCLSEMVSDTRMLAGAELYEFASVVYKMANIIKPW
jgi:hypothetical protein